MDIKIPKWNITELTGYEPQTTFWSDFSIADRFGLNSIKGTYNRAFYGWKHDHIYITELAMVLNHKCWEHYHRSRNELTPFLDNHAEVGQWYKDAYYKLLDWADENLKGKELEYFYRTID